MLLFLILLWFCTSTAVFLIKLYRHFPVSSPVLESCPISEADDDEQDIVGGVRTVSSALPLQQSVPDEQQYTVSDEYEIENFSFEEDLSQGEMNDGSDSCTAGELQTYHDAMNCPNEIFEQQISDPQKLSQLLQTNTKLEDSVYYNKLRENREFDSRSCKLSEILKQRYEQHVQRLLAENTVAC